MVRCAFCEGSMTSRPVGGSSNGETGGIWQVERYECGTCGGAVDRDVTEKIGQIRERWRIKQLPAAVTPRGALHCPGCDSVLVSAWPPDVRPVPITTFTVDFGRAERRTEHACPGCDARFEMVEHVETSWTTNGALVASPRPYPRSR
jgi:hypothetical protein